MTGTDTVGGALRAAVERVHGRRAWAVWPEDNMIDYRPFIAAEIRRCFTPEIAAALLGAAEAADVGALR